jgi:hypothetical protein
VTGNTILALDPGTTQTGWVEYGGDNGIIESGIMPNEQVLEMLKRAHRPDYHCLAIEMIASYGMAVGREVFETCVWIGRFQQAWIEWPGGADVRLVYRRTVKLHLCESVKAKDTNIWQALVDKFGEPGTKKAPGGLYGVRSHARAALALAVTVAEQSSPPIAPARAFQSRAPSALTP